MEYTTIKKSTVLPDDFVVKSVLNREKYVIEAGRSSLDKWNDEFNTHVSAEIVGAILIGSDIYIDYRFRVRTESDPEWELSKTFIGKLYSSL